MIMDLKVAFSGPSGLGKTTQCQYLEGLGLKWLSTSAGDIFDCRDKDIMKKQWGYTQSGHRDVINLSSARPEFGSFFQFALLRRRGYQIMNSQGFVIDRSPIDNVVYMLTQIAHNLDQKEIERFIGLAQQYYKQLSHVILIEFSRDIPFIEDNGSRIPNTYYQAYISDVFRAVYVRYFANIPGPRVMTLDHFNLDSRKAAVKEFVFPSQLHIGYEEGSN